MPAYRPLFLCAVAAGLLASVPAADAGSPPVWQPYRRLIDRNAPYSADRAFREIQPTPLASTVPAPFVPQQYVVVEPGCEIPVDAVTDIELDQLRHDFVDPLTIDIQQFDPSLQGHPIFTTAADRGPLRAFRLLPSDVLWHSYWAGAKEPKTAATMFKETGQDTSLLDVTLGGRTSLARNVVRDACDCLHGWELQIEGAALLRLNLDENWDFDSADFRFGVPFILARNQLHWKFAYYHLSSHVGDEFLVRNPGFQRINFSRDVLVFGASYFPLPAWRWYAETGWAFYDDEGSDPWEFQFGLDYAQPGYTGKQGTPFVALNGHLREEVHFGGNMVLQAGWLWRGRTGRALRTGLHYYNGKSPQYEFFDQFEQQIGVGLWQEY